MKRVLPLLLLILGFISVTSESQAQIPGLPNRWNTVTMVDLDTGRVAAAVFTIGDKSYVVGGDTSGYFGAYTRWTRDVWAYSHSNNTWTKMAPFPGDPRLGAVAFGSTSTGKGYYGLGYDSTGNIDTIFHNNDYDTIPYYRKTFYKDWWEYDTATNSWSQKNDFPVDTYLGTALTPTYIATGVANASGFSIDTMVKVNGSAAKFYAGGFVFGEYWNLEIDSIKAWPTPWPDETWDGYVQQKFNKTPFFYDPATDSWVAGPDCPGPGRSNAVALVIDSDQDNPGRDPRLYCGLGDADEYNVQLLNVYRKDWYSYDFATNNWKVERNLPDTGRTTAGAFAYEHLGFVVCGFDSEWSKKFFVWNTKDAEWQRYPDYRDSSRSLGVAFLHGNRGYYGAGFRGMSEELETFSFWTIDTTTIRVKSFFTPGDTFCAGSDVTVEWWSGATFNAGATVQMQVSDGDGVFEWPVTPKSDMGVTTITGNSDTITGTLPMDLKRGAYYRIRFVTSSPLVISRLSDTFFVKDNPSFNYLPKIFPPIDTVCVNAENSFAAYVSGSIDSVGQFNLEWLYNGSPTGVKNDTFTKVFQMSNEGEYRLVAKGDCFADTSEVFTRMVENIPPPVITDNLDFPGMVGNQLFLCEYDSNTFYVAASGKDVHYRWYWNNQPLDQRDNIQGLGSRFIFNRQWHMSDSGSYKVRVIENCGAFVESDSIVVKMRAIPRVTRDPISIEPAILSGTTAGFGLRATGYALQYQWRRDATFLSDDGRIVGANTDSLIINNVGAGDVALYSCIITGGCPNFGDTTNLAILDVNAAPSIIKQPADTLELCEGADNVISIIATGTDLGYRWHWVPDTAALNPAMFSGADKRVLVITNAIAGYQGWIRCEVDNGAGNSIFSNLVYFKVKPNPGKPAVPAKSGSLLVAGPPCETYIWFLNGIYKSDYNTKTIKPKEEGDYTYRVICDGCPSEMSDPYYFLTSIVRNDADMLQMYPNPASYSVMLDLPGIHAGNKATVRIYDLSGKLVSEVNDVESDSYELNIEGLSKGLYVVTVVSPEKSFSGKLLKE